MGSNKPKQGQVTDEKKDENAQTPAAETPQTENPAPSETPTADDADKDGNASEQPKDENSQTPAAETPAQADSGDTQPPVTQPADSGVGDGNGDSTPTDTPSAGEKDGSEEQPEGGGSQPVDESADGGKTEDKKVKLTLRHKSHTQHYYRCGLMLTKVFAEYEVSKEALAKIKADKWIEIKGSK